MRKILVISIVLVAIIGVPASFADISTTNYGLDLLTTKLTEIITQVNLNSGDITGIQANVTTNTNQITTISTQSTNNANQITTNTNNITTNTNQITTISADVTSNTNQITTVSNDVTSNTNQINTVSSIANTNTGNVNTNTLDIQNILSNSNSNKIWISAQDLMRDTTDGWRNYETISFNPGSPKASTTPHVIPMPDSWTDQPVDITFYYLQRSTLGGDFDFDLRIMSFGIGEFIPNGVPPPIDITILNQRAALSEYTLNNVAVDTNSNDPLIIIQLTSDFSGNTVRDNFEFVGMSIEY